MNTEASEVVRNQNSPGGNFPNFAGFQLLKPQMVENFWVQSCEFLGSHSFETPNMTLYTLQYIISYSKTPCLFLYLPKFLPNREEMSD